MTEKLDIIKKRYDEINEELLKPENISDYYKQKELLKEKSNLSPIVEEYQNFINLNNEIRDLKILIDDIELGEYAKSELDIKNEIINKIRNNLELLLIPKDENDGKDIIMEIRGAAGGDEANIFAADLFRMYSKYAETQKWIIEINDIIENQNGGFSKIDLIIRGNNVYSKLKFESGVHRVQRVPQTESQGRVHTSTATVLVMPEINDIDVDIKPDDIRIDVYRSSGKGGQGVNTTDSAVRITHLPTNIVVTCQKERSQIKNKDRAMRVLKSKIYDLKLQKQITENESKRLSKIGTGDRSEKIRTYNYPQNRITDHRINYSIMELDKVIDGNLDPLIDFLTSEDQKRKMELSI